jgi:hypothetical protein
MYLLMENNASPATDLMEIQGVAGVWTATSQSVGAKTASAPVGQTISYLFLDDDPVVTAARLRTALEKRWSDGIAEPLFAAPFYPVVPHEWDRYVP